MLKKIPNSRLYTIEIFIPPFLLFLFTLLFETASLKFNMAYFPVSPFPFRNFLQLGHSMNYAGISAAPMSVLRVQSWLLSALKVEGSHEGSHRLGPSHNKIIANILSYNAIISNILGTLK